jgi:hypothetical protein
MTDMKLGIHGPDMCLRDLDTLVKQARAAGMSWDADVSPAAGQVTVAEEIIHAT